ncbi:prostate stem cell antigen-like [Latimeria chalumnae]|uniref:prostate stem cell antigen-like n=1 Tax=Latimeria chalumnae TaxID=7897 RepID=UPI0003C1A5A5|nr:PREDICTED: prostate stem cell antigen-like [Latimeria chalumnae]|eukprot:XP_006013400.1 PREDICTED: prostate stem cell antigen-like [Latimeria chalumnae]
MKLNVVVLFLVFFLFQSNGKGLKCYTCVFPTISPFDCLKFPEACPPNFRCLRSTAVGKKGDFQITFHEKSCAASLMCDVVGTKTTLGINFTYHSTCCDTDLCNGSGPLDLSPLAATVPGLALLALWI